jgi:D-alanyl-D-alanine carboxypeptidase (penicillin-binding protein 5/6)
MLQGMLIGSANNYAHRLATTIWPTDAVFAQAANEWLAQHGVPGITIADPSGIDADNTASADALIALADRALENPVIAEIVRTPSVELPGAGLVKNSNPLLADPGVIGLKTGTLDEYNLLAAKEVVVGDTNVRMYASALGQPDRDTRDAATRALFAQLEQELQLRPSVTAGTVVGQVQTEWGEPVPIVVADDADVVLWNGAAASVSSTFELGDHRDDGDVVGSLEAVGPLDAESVELVLDGDVDEPSPWWRLTHPLQLFGLA